MMVLVKKSVHSSKELPKLSDWEKFYLKTLKEYPIIVTKLKGIRNDITEM